MYLVQQELILLPQVQIFSELQIFYVNNFQIPQPLLANLKSEFFWLIQPYENQDAFRYDLATNVE